MNTEANNRVEETQGESSPEDFQDAKSTIEPINIVGRPVSVAEFNGMLKLDPNSQHRNYMLDQNSVEFPKKLPRVSLCSISDSEITNIDCAEDSVRNLTGQVPQVPQENEREHTEEHVETDEMTDDLDTTEESDMSSIASSNFTTGVVSTNISEPLPLSTPTPAQAINTSKTQTSSNEKSPIFDMESVEKINKIVPLTSPSSPMTESVGNQSVGTQSLGSQPLQYQGYQGYQTTPGSIGMNSTENFTSFSNTSTTNVGYKPDYRRMQTLMKRAAENIQQKPVEDVTVNAVSSWTDDLEKYFEVREVDYSLNQMPELSASTASLDTTDSNSSKVNSHTSMWLKRSNKHGEPDIQSFNSSNSTDECSEERGDDKHHKHKLRKLFKSWIVHS